MLELPPYSTGQSSMASTGLRPRAISSICGQPGLTRASAIRSARPCCKMASAKCGSTMRPTAIDMIPASLRTHSAKATWNPPRPLDAGGRGRAVKTRTAQHQATPVGEVKALSHPGAGGVGGHRCNDHAVLEGHVYDANWREEQRLGHGWDCCGRQAGGGQQQAGQAV